MTFTRANIEIVLANLQPDSLTRILVEIYFSGKFRPVCLLLSRSPTKVLTIVDTLYQVSMTEEQMLSSIKKVVYIINQD